jgi:predicted short-subunit dehydrogenase-like oxidoreductase (DUF2520 family)
MNIAIVGPGRLAQSLAPALKQAGYRVTEIIAKPAPPSLARARKLAKSLGARASTLAQPQGNTDLLWFCVPDSQTARAAKDAAKSGWNGKLAFHSSGALTSDELKELRKEGAAVASVHPLMTFVSGSRPSLPNVPWALEGDSAAVAAAKKIVGRLGGKPFLILAKDKPAYHAWGTFASPLLIALLATTEQVAKTSGSSRDEARRKMLPILQQTLANYAALGPAKAFSGPIVRGDAAILRRHLNALKKIPHAVDVYRALAQAALQYLPVQHREKSLAALAKIRKPQRTQRNTKRFS